MSELTHEEQLEASRPTGASKKKKTTLSDGREEPYDEEPEVPQK